MLKTYISPVESRPGGLVDGHDTLFSTHCQIIDLTQCRVKAIVFDPVTGCRGTRIQLTDIVTRRFELLDANPSLANLLHISRFTDNHPLMVSRHHLAQPCTGVFQVLCVEFLHNEVNGRVSGNIRYEVLLCIVQITGDGQGCCQLCVIQSDRHIRIGDVHFVQQFINLQYEVSWNFATVQS